MYLVATGNAEIYVLDIASKILTNITNNAAEDLEPAWSPDGGRLAFASNRDGDFDIYIADADGSDPLSLTDSEEDDESGFDERWPDFGNYEGAEIIAFASNREGNWEIHTYSNAEKRLRKTNSMASDAAPSWKFYSQEFVFHTGRDQDTGGLGLEVFRMTKDGEEGRNLTKSDSSNDAHPDWEPVEHTKTCGEPAPTSVPIPTPTPIVVPEPIPAPTPTPTATPTPEPTPTPMPTPTPEPTPTPTPEPMPVELPDYPAGGRIAFQSDRDGNSEIYMMGCDGSGQVNLTNNSADDKQPSWATGGRLTFSSNRNAEGGFDIYLLTLDPWGIIRLTTNAANDESPALSLDGSKAAFVSYRDSDGDAEIYVMTISDGSLVKITDNTAADMDPAWSPDGTKLVFASDRDGDFDIYTVNPDGIGLEKIAAVSHNEANDRWPDLGDYDGNDVIAFTSDRDEDWEVYTYITEGEDYSELIRTTRISGTDSSPKWGPSGDEFVFHTNRDANFEVYVADSAYADVQTNVMKEDHSDSKESNESSPDWEPVEGGGYCGE